MLSDTCVYMEKEREMGEMCCVSTGEDSNVNIEENLYENRKDGRMNIFTN